MISKSTKKQVWHYINHKNKTVECNQPGHKNRLLSLNLCSVFQIMIGTKLILLALLGLVNPSWLVTAMQASGGILTVAGIYLIYSNLATVYQDDSLIRNSIDRVVTDKN
jgi:hypothetical protein